MKKLSIILCACYVSLGFSATPSSVQTDISFNFSANIITVEDAIDAILSPYGYTLQKTNQQGDYAQAMLAHNLTTSQRKLISSSLTDALIALSGDDFDIAFDDKNVSFQIKEVVLKRLKKHQGSNTDDSLIKNSPCQQFLDTDNYSIRLSQALIADGLNIDDREGLIKYSQNHQIYFSFNNDDQIATIAQTQKEANALSVKQPEVFFMLAGKTLKDTINQWSQSVGIKSYYVAKKDLVIEAPSVFFGKFDAENGALVQLLSSARESGVDLKAQFNSNNVVVIQDHSYAPILLRGENND